ncbi:hypothetical protein [Sulfurovum sp.]|uniref:hypothetical protein n=1 Tax=Sulfurovum sp. TaxID=1969726 RepID=UPI003561F25A
MKKTLLLSVVASTMIMAGGDIAPVEPVVAAPVEAAAWNFNGQAVAYIQTTDEQGNSDLFSGSSTYGSLGLQLGATNADVFAGIGAGVEVSTIQQDEGFSQIPGTGVGNAQVDSSALTQAYLTYGLDNINTSFKVGRQTLPKSLSPFAFSEGWQVFNNTFDAALVVNSSIPNTTAVYAYVTKHNNSVGDISDFNRFWDADGVHMITLSNKSIEGLTLTGSYYMLPDATKNLVVNGGDADAYWIDAQYDGFDAFTIAAQGGGIDADGLWLGQSIDDVTAFGAKISGKVSMFNLAVAYSSVSDGNGPLTISNLAGAGVKTPLYTQSILNQNAIKKDSDTVKASASMKALAGTIGLHYIYADMGADAIGSVFNNGNADDLTQGVSGDGEYTEVDLTYKTKVFDDSTTLFAGYVYQDDDRLTDSQNFLRFWARYNF